jgi:hypothetical protein
MLQAMGSIPDRVIGIFNLLIPSSCIMVLRSTQPLTEMSSKVASLGGRGGSGGMVMVYKSKHSGVSHIGSSGL